MQRLAYFGGTARTAQMSTTTIYKGMVDGLKNVSREANENANALGYMGLEQHKHLKGTYGP